MADLIPKNTDEEMERYDEADMVRRARIPMEGNAALKFEHDPVTKRENAYFPLSSGGYVKIGDRAVTPEQAAETDVLAAEREIQNDARGPISEVMGGAGGPVLDDYLAADFTEAEVRQYEAERAAAALEDRLAAAQEPGFGPAATLTEEQMQFGEEVGAPMLTEEEASLRDRVQSSIFNAMSATEDPKGPVGEAVRSMLQGITGSELIDPADLRFWSNYLTDVVDITVPGLGGAISLDEGARIAQQGYQTGNTVDMLVGGLVFGMGALELVPIVKSLTAPARQALADNLSPEAKNLLADAIGATRAIAQRDREMLMEIFQPAGTPRSLGAAGVDDAGLERNTQEYLNQIGVETPPSRGGMAGRISTRLPTAARATEDPMTGELVIGYDELRADPKVFEPNVNITRDYPNMRPQPGATTEETAEQFIGHVKDNLLYLHDQVPEATRTRSQLWYDGARNITDRWSQQYGVPDTGIAGALAALSPQKDWYQNVSLAQRVLDVIRPTTNTPTRFMPEMEETFRRIDSLNKPKYEPLLDAIRGRSYNEITDPDPAVQNALRALFVRLHDQTFQAPSYRIVGPEGDFLDVATNADGSPSRVAWGSLNEIGKAVGSIEANGDVKTISRLMGERHKVRNFYNNIYDPNSPYGDVTIDTHAVAAGLLRPLSGNSLEVDHNFKNTSVPGRGTTKGSAVSGVSGNYGLYAEAYRRAAEERGILPRQMQSITWEAVRGLFPDTFKTERNANIIDGIWNRFRSGEMEIDEARRMVNEAAGGINPPTWQQ